MGAIEITGYVQIVVGLAGIVVTLLATPTFLDGLSKIRTGDGVPKEFAGIGGAFRVFSIVAVLVVLFFLVGLGLSVTLSTLASSLGSPHPLLSSSLGIASLFALSVTITLVAYQNPLWVPGVIGSLLLAVMAVISSVSADLRPLFGTGALGAFIFLFAGLLVLMGADDDRRPG